MRNPPARAIASRSGTAQWCSIRSSAAAESFGISSSTSHSSPEKKSIPPCSATASAPASAPASKPSSPSMPRPISARNLAAELDRLVTGEVAEVHDLDLAVGVLVDRERVDDAHGVALAELLELGDDLTVEVRVLEAEHDQLYRSDCHLPTSLSRDDPRSCRNSRGGRPAETPSTTRRRTRSPGRCSRASDSAAASSAP